MSTLKNAKKKVKEAATRIAAAKERSDSIALALHDKHLCRNLLHTKIVEAAR